MSRMKPPFLVLFAAVLLTAGVASSAADRDMQTIAEYMRAGKTLPAEFCEKYPLPGKLPKNDTGINVLLDQAHQTQFVLLWGMRGALNKEGFRACSSIACLDTVLLPKGQSRVRLQVGEKENRLEPYAWWPNVEYNVVITFQSDRKAQQYTERERNALKWFVENGGGLLVIGGSVPKDKMDADAWSMNGLAKLFGARFTVDSDKVGRKKMSVPNLGREWEVLETGANGKPVRARRNFKKGRVMIAETPDIFNADKKKVNADTAERNRKALADAVHWLAEGKRPVGGKKTLPSVGGVGIFPEKEANLGSIIVYYAANQPDTVKQCIQQDIPDSAAKIRQWLPGKVYDEPYAIVMPAGGGGGWAINPRPKAAAVITYQPLGLLGVFAHEMAHTMGGPRNEKGELAGRSPHVNQGESQAGWFQGKILAIYDPKRQEQSNRNCNSILDKEAKAGKKVDVANFDRDEWGKGTDWTKHWYIFQKLDDRYGPAWYPRWYWVRSTRWADDPQRKLSWDETVEDMSIAVGEDLFPFFKKIGTTLSRDRLEQTEFEGQTLRLPVAPIDAGPAGNVCLDPVGDYTQPLTLR
ncbi:MAG: hypothetical protein K9M45_09900 [Kiritimatiellales bacterium]|nr:hypothetical protein [Kiritimatiellales bacterium]